ncbi:APC family permease [Nakamurella antarctica]|uniref:APC family permease n=1 Tax=Nakamurella antarctica TaxID=1902245 RepID=A0A3G8ZUK2_9ACTN|nr:APC family permease [Nakamurella antarctica]AZI57696.1 APC family permease [Nakamurella antarctica]
MSKATRAFKRILVGRAFRSDKLSHTLLPKRIALPVFASDALSSVAYAPQEIFTVLSVAGLAAYSYAPWIAALVAFVMIVVVLSYRQNVHAYPSGGGDYEVATKNLGQRFGLLVGSALMVDYILTVAVSTAAGVANIGSAIRVVGDNPVAFSVGIIVLVTAANLRGLKEAGAAFAIPVYAFILSVFAMLITGLIRYASNSEMRAESAGFEIVATHSLSGVALVFLLLRAFSSGSAALTGVEAISNGVPAFKKPKSKNAATTLAMMGVMSVTMLLGIVALARITQVHIAEPGLTLVGMPEDFHEKTLIAQIAQAVFSGFPIGFYIVSFTTGLILVLACNTAFSGFPVLGSILAQDRFLPRQLHTRGDRLAFSNGIVGLALVAVVLIIAFKADVTSLIQLYIVGVFVSFTTSQAGMIRHWKRLLATEKDPARRRILRRSQIISFTGFVMTGTVLVIVLITKFLSGAWITLLAMAVIYSGMVGIRKHYDRVASEVAADEDDLILPSRIHAIVLVSKLHLPTMRALGYARATRPDTLEAVTVNVDPVETANLAREWEDRGLPVPLKVIDSPFREITKPILDYVRRVRKDSPRDVVAVFVPEYVVGHWWEQILHNQSALRLKGRLLFTPGVMVTSVPWQTASSEAAKARMKERSDREVSAAGRRSAATRFEENEDD